MFTKLVPNICFDTTSTNMQWIMLSYIISPFQTPLCLPRINFKITTKTCPRLEKSRLWLCRIHHTHYLRYNRWICAFVVYATIKRKHCNYTLVICMWFPLYHCIWFVRMESFWTMSTNCIRYYNVQISPTPGYKIVIYTHHVPISGTSCMISKYNWKVILISCGT